MVREMRLIFLTYLILSILWATTLRTLTGPCSTHKSLAKMHPATCSSGVRSFLVWQQYARAVIFFFCGIIDKEKESPRTKTKSFYI